MPGKQIIITTVLFSLVLFIYLFTKNVFINRFVRLEKNQQIILSELKKIKNQTKPTPTESPFTSSQNLGKIREELAKIKNQVEDQSEILGFETFESSPTATPSINNINFVSVSDKRWLTVDVFADKNSSSKIIGQAIYGESYPYLKKENNYYYIQINNNTFGWIHSQFVKEI